MKKIFLLTALALVLTITGCKKETKAECDEFAYGSMKFNNNTGFGVKITVDGSYRGIAPPYGNYSVDKQAQGVHSFKAESMNSFGVVIGTINGSLSVFKCSVAEANLN